MKKKYYLEAVRIFAILLVMYNHSAPFMSFATQSGVEYAVSFFLSLTCKAAVPLFFMVSGALLLGKNESFQELLKKRVVRIIAVIVIFSFLYYVKLAARGYTEFTPVKFLLRLPFDLVFLPYWYLYSYLGMLIILPILRPLAQNMTKNTFIYLIGLQMILGSLNDTMGFFGYSTLCGYFNVSALFHQVIFYPLIGYGLDKFIEETRFFGGKNILRNVAYLAAATVTWAMVYGDYQNAGTYQEMHLSTWMPLITVVLFLNIKILVKEERLNANVKKVLSTVGSCVFGIYLLDGFIGTGGRMDFIYQKFMPYIGYLPAFCIEIFVVFFIRFALAWVMKKMPVLRKLL